jgi:hypothetical protein
MEGRRLATLQQLRVGRLHDERRRCHANKFPLYAVRELRITHSPVIRNPRVAYNKNT